MLLHPLKPHAGSATATMVARWRMLMGICEASQSLGDGFASGLTGCARFFSDGWSVYDVAQPNFAVPSLLLKRVKLAYLGDIGIKIPQKLPALKIVTARIDDEFAPPLAAIASIAAIDIAARLRRHAAPVRG